MPAPSQPAAIDQPSVNPSVITYTSALGFPLPIKSRKDMPDSLAPTANGMTKMRRYVSISSSS